MWRITRFGTIGRNGGIISTIMNDCINVALLTKSVKRRLTRDDGMICSWNKKDRSGGLKEEEGKKLIEPAAFALKTSITSGKRAGFKFCCVKG
mgnify:CR=1 FL=1